MNIILLHGSHSFLRVKFREKTIQNYREKKGDRIIYFNLGETEGIENLNKLKQKLTTGSLFAEDELLVVNLADKINNSIIDYLAGIPTNITLLLEAPVKLPASEALLKSIKRLEGEIRLFEIAAARNKEALITSARRFLTDNKVEIDLNFINRLIEQSQGNWWFVFSALEQAVLLLRALDKERDDECIARLWDMPAEKNIFRLFDAIGNGNQAEAFSLLYVNTENDKMKTDTAVETVLGFTSLMARQLRQMLAVKGGASLSQAQKEFQVPNFAYGKLKHQASGFDITLLVNAYQKLVEIQEKAKSGLWSPLSLIDFFVIYLVSRRATQ